MKIEKGHLLLFYWTPLASGFLLSHSPSNHQRRHSRNRCTASLDNQNNALFLSSQNDMDQLAREWAARNADDSSGDLDSDTAHSIPEAANDIESNHEDDYDPAMPPGGQTFESSSPSSTGHTTGYSKVQNWVMGDPEKKSYSFAGKTYGVNGNGETTPSITEPVNSAPDLANNAAPASGTFMADLAAEWAARNTESGGSIEAPSMMEQPIYESVQEEAPGEWPEANAVETTNKSELETYPQPVASEEYDASKSMADLATTWASMNRDEENSSPEDALIAPADESMQTIAAEVEEDIVVSYSQPEDQATEQTQVSEPISLEGKTKEVIKKIAESEPKQFSDGTGAILLGFAASLLALIPIGLGSFSPPTKEMPETSVPIRSQPAPPSSSVPRSSSSASPSGFGVTPASKYNEPVSDSVGEPSEGKAPSEAPRVIPKYSEETKRTTQQTAPTDEDGPQTFEEVMSQKK